MTFKDLLDLIFVAEPGKVEAFSRGMGHNRDVVREHIAAQRPDYVLTPRLESVGAKGQVVPAYFPGAGERTVHYVTVGGSWIGYIASPDGVSWRGYTPSATGGVPDIGPDRVSHHEAVWDVFTERVMRGL